MGGRNEADFIKIKIDKLDFIKSRELLYSLKNTIKKIKRQATAGENIFKGRTDKNFVS